MYIVALIPARGGSKSIPKKNIKLFHNKPLIAHTIEQAKKIELINDIYVTTDDKNIAEISSNYGATIPYIRPADISGDYSTDYEFLKYHIDWVKDNNMKIPDLIIQMRPTYPNRDISKIKDMINKFIDNYNEYDSLRTVIKLNLEYPPFKMYYIDNNDKSQCNNDNDKSQCNNELKPLFNTFNDIKEPYNQPRQLFPDIYWHNGYIDIIKPNTILLYNSVSGKKILPYILNSNEVFDIDTYDEWKKAEQNFIIQ